MKKAPLLKLRPRVRLERGPGDDRTQGLLIDAYSATLSLCNDSAWELLTALKRGASSDELVGLLTTRYDVAEATTRHDVAVFTRQLRSMGLLDAGA